MTYKCLFSLSMNSLEMREVYLFLAPLFQMYVLKYKILQSALCHVTTGTDTSLIFSQVRHPKSGAWSAL